MSSLESLEAAVLSEGDELLCEIDATTRAITVPAGCAIAGVRSDDLTHVITIKVPRYVDTSCDLSTFSAAVNYMNGNGAVAMYPFNVSNTEVYSEYILLRWNLSRLAMAYAGTLRFSVCFRKVSGANVIEREWNSTIAEITVLDGLEASEIDTGVLKQGLEELLLNATNLRAEMVSRVEGKVDKVTGKGLSSNDYTDAEKARVNTLTDEYISHMVASESGTTLRTVTAAGADYAAVCEWSDGNPNNQSRVGYFVTIDTSKQGSTIIKATDNTDVRGVTMVEPGFASAAELAKYNSSGQLLAKYAYVGFAGVVPVIDNNTCTVGGLCMSGSDGTAVPSPNTVGYRVVGRVDDTHILVHMKAGVDAVHHMQDAVDTTNDRIDQLVAANAAVETRTSLYKGVLYTSGSTAALSDAFTKYDRIEIIYAVSGLRSVKSFDVGYCTNQAVYITTPNIANGTSNTDLTVTEFSITFSGSTVTLNALRNLQIKAGGTHTHTENTSTSQSIREIIGVRYSGNAELIDLRLGLDGQVYGTAGEAVRAHLQQLNDIQDDIARLEDEISEINTAGGTSGGSAVPDGTYALANHTHSQYLTEDDVEDMIPSADITANTNARHTHDNKTVLDGLTAEKVSSWDGKAEGTHTHAQYLTEHQSLKTINGQSIVGVGNIAIEGGSGGTATDIGQELTQAEYNALTDEEKATGIYWITDASPTGTLLTEDDINDLIDAKLTPLETLADEILEVM